MSFFSSVKDSKKQAAVCVNFFGSENIASVAFEPQPVSIDDFDSLLNFTMLFLSFYVRTTCDLSIKEFSNLMSSMEAISYEIIDSCQNGTPMDNVTAIDHNMHFSKETMLGVTRSHTCELYVRKNGEMFPQSKWSPLHIEQYGPKSVLFYYQSIIDQQPEECVYFLATRIRVLHQYFYTIGGKPNIFKLSEAVKFSMSGL